MHVERDELGMEWMRAAIPHVNEYFSPSSIYLPHRTRSQKDYCPVRRHFTCPCICRDIKQFCASCPQCQRASKNNQGKALLSPLPVIIAPFSGWAFDVVGPMPRTKFGNRFVLTCMRHANKYPNVVLMKQAEAMTILKP